MDLNAAKISIPPDKPGYIISLDNLDLNLLYSYDRSTTVPLWSVQSPEYMEFQVFSKEIPSDSDGEEKDDLNRRCHICEVDVPVSYIEAHNVSTKHQLYVAIAQISLDRVKKQEMAGELVPVESCALQPSTYYCEHCAQAVNCSDQESHDASKEHEVCKNRDKIMKKMLLIYQNPSHFEKVFEEFKENIPVTKNHTFDKFDSRDQVFLYPKRVNPMTAHKIHYIDDFTVVISAKSGAQLAVGFDNYHGFFRDAGKVVCRVCRVLIDDKYKHINDDGHIKKMTAAIGDEHCIRQLDQILSHCILCNENIGNREAHIFGEKHMSALKEALIDDEVYKQMKKDFDKYDTNINTEQDWWEEVFLYPKRVNPMTAHKIHYIDDYTVEISAKSGAKLAVGFDNFHGFCEDAGKVLCRVCRVLINDKYKHLNDDGHIKKITATIEDKHCIRRLDPILNHCILCNEVMENTEFHIATEKHATALKDSILDITSEVNKMLMTNSMSVSDFDKNVYFCNACQIYVEHNSLQQHIELEYHVELLNKSKGKRDIQFNKKVACKEYCYTCDVHIQGGKKEMKAHRKTIDHKYLDWLPRKELRIHYHLKKIDHVNNATCKVCKIIISGDKTATTEHIASIEHQTEYKKLLLENRMEVVDQKHISCKACNTLVPIFLDLVHTNKKSHRNNVAKKNMLLNSDDQTPTYKEDVYVGDYCTVCRVSVKGGEEGRKNHHIFSDHRYKVYLYEMEKGIRYHYHVTPTSDNKVFCKLCKIEIEANNIKIQKHIESEKHGAKYRAKSYNLITRTSDARVQCHLCNSSVMILDEIQHLTTKRHLRNLREHGYTMKSSDSETDTSCSDAFDKLENVSKETLQCNNLIKMGSEYFCQACHATVEHKFLDIHIDSDLHRINLSKYQSANKIDVNIPGKDNELEAKPKQIIKSLHYVYEFDDCFAEVRCKICNVRVAFDQMVKHRQENSHKQNFRDLLNVNTMFRIHYISFCECCREIVKLNLEYEHFTSEKHARNLSNMDTRIDAAKILEIAESMFREYDAIYQRKRNDSKILTEIRDDSSNYSTCEESEENKEVSNKTLLYSNNLIACKDPVPNSWSDYSENSESENSYASAKTTLTENKQTSDTERLSEHQSDNLTSYILSDFEHLFRKDNPEHLLCQICYCLVPFRYDLFIEHVQGVKHTTKYEAFLLKNDIRECVDSEKETIKQYYCFTCGIDLPNSHLIPHVTDSSHKINLINTGQSCSGELKQTLLPQNLELASKVHRMYFMVESDTDLFCKLCDSEVQSKDIITHIQNASHLTNTEAVLHEHEIRKLSDLIVCDLCKISFEEGNEIEHIFSENHKRNINRFSLPTTKCEKQNVISSYGYLCGVCNVKLLGSETVVKLHNEGIRHKRNVLKSAAATAQSPMNTPVQNVQPQKRIQIKKYALCEICKVKYEDNPDDKRKHEGSHFHKSYEDFLKQTTKYSKPSITKDSTKMKPQIVSCSNNMTGFSFIPEVPMYYWCEGYDKDPFYLISAILENSKLPTVIGNQSTESANQISLPKSQENENSKYSAVGDCSIYSVKLASADVAEHMLGARHKKNDKRKHEERHFHKTRKEFLSQTTKYVKPPNTKDSSKTKPQIVSCGTNTTVFSFIPDVPIYYWSESYDKDPFYLISAINMKYNTESIPQIADCSNNMADINFIPGVAMYYWCESYDKDPFYLISTKNTQHNTKTKPQMADCSNNMTVINFIPEVPMYYWCESYDKDPFYLISAINSKLSTVVKNQSTESANQITQSKPQQNIDSKHFTSGNYSICSTKVAPGKSEDLSGATHKKNMPIINSANEKNNPSPKQITQPQSQENIDSKYFTKGSIRLAKVAPANVYEPLLGARLKENVAVVDTAKEKKNEGLKQVTQPKSQKSSLYDSSYLTNATICSAKVAPANVAEHLLAAIEKKNLVSTKEKENKSLNQIMPPQSLENINTKYLSNGYCSICSAKVAPANVAEHLLGARHRENVAIAAKSKFTSSEHINHVINGFCTVCKVKVPSGSANIAVHMLGANHKNNVEKSKTTTNTNSGLDLTNHVVNGFCTVCKVKVPNGSVNIAEHVKGTYHKTNLAIVEKSKTNNNSGSDLTNHVVNGFCNVCKVKLSNGSVNIAEHIKGVQHKENVALEKTKTDTNTNSGSNVTNHVVNGFCTVCKVKVPNGSVNIADHVKGANHKTNLAILEKSKTTTNTNYLGSDIINHVVNGVCVVCNVKVTGGAANIAEHVKGTNHKDSVANIEKNKTFTNTNSVSSHVVNGFCSVCKVKVHNSIANITEHVNGALHKNNVAIAEKNKRPTEIIVPTLSRTVKYLDVYNSIPGTKHQLCTLCNIKVSNSIKSLDQHLAGTMHKENSEIADMFDLTDTTERLCKVCDVKVPNTPDNMRQHFHGMRHKDNAQKFKNITQMKTKSLGLQVAPAVASSNKTDGISCDICHVKMLNVHNFKAHLLSQRHKNTFDNLSGTQKQEYLASGGQAFQLFATMLEGENSRRNNTTVSTSNDVTQTSSKESITNRQFTCQICNVSVPNNPNNITDHIKGNKHIINVAKLKSTTVSTPNDITQTNPKEDSRHFNNSAAEYTCPICNVSVSYNPNSITEHIKGNKHIINVAKLKFKKESKNEVPKNQPLMFCNSALNIHPTSFTEAAQLYTSAKDTIKNTNSHLSSSLNINEPSTSKTNKVAASNSILNINEPSTSKTNKVAPSDSTLNINEPSTSKTNKIAPSNSIPNISKTNKVAPSDSTLNINEPSTSKTNKVAPSISIPNTSKTNNSKVAPPNTSTSNTEYDRNTKTNSEDDDDGFFICKICKVLVDNNQTAIQSHLHSFKHINNMKEKATEDSQEVKLYNCEICKRKLTDNPITIKAHNESELHNRRLDDLLSLNKIKIRDNKVCYCELCDLYFSKFSVLLHIVKDKHKTLMTKASDSPVV